MRKKSLSVHKISPANGLLATVILLSLIGLLFVFESSVAQSYQLFETPYHFVIQHTAGLLAGLTLFFIAQKIPSDYWAKLAPATMILGIVLMVLVFIPPIGLSLNGASRWVSLAGFTFQSVEFFKFAFFSYLALWLKKEPSLLPFLMMIALPTILLLLQPDLGSLLLILSVATTLFFVAGGQIKELALLSAIGVPAVMVAILTSPYRLKRLTTFLNPDSDPLGASFHIRQITLALGRGGILGQGIGNSNQKYAFIPEVSTDSIFAIVAEELGFLGSFLIICLFFFFFLFSFRIITKPKLSTEKKLLGTAIVLWIAYQTLLNLGAVVALIPLTGIPLPFFSYGRSSQLMLLFASGILYKLGKES